MKIFVTVGTTRFDRLIHFVASQEFFRSNEVTLQVGPGGPMVEGFNCLEYTNDIVDFYHGADVVVTHAGAGSIFQLLEMRKSIVIVPNLDRVDSHQSDITNYMHQNGYAISALKLDELQAAILKAAQGTSKPFTREKFFSGLEIVEAILPFSD